MHINMSNALLRCVCVCKKACNYWYILIYFLRDELEWKDCISRLCSYKCRTRVYKSNGSLQCHNFKLFINLVSNKCSRIHLQISFLEIMDFVISIVLNSNSNNFLLRMSYKRKLLHNVINHLCALPKTYNLMRWT